MKAEVLSDVLGGSLEDYLGLVDAFCFSNTNDLIEMVLTDSNILTKYSSYIE